MNKSELVEALATHYDGSRADATRALNAFVHTISSATASGERVAITGFGVFERVERPARTVRNPRTGERLDVPATAVPRFRAGTELKAYVSGSRPVPELAAAPATTRRPSAPVTEPAAPAEPKVAPEPEVAAEPEVTAASDEKPKTKKATKVDKAKTDKAKTSKAKAKASKAKDDKKSDDKKSKSKGKGKKK